MSHADPPLPQALEYYAVLTNVDKLTSSTPQTSDPHTPPKKPAFVSYTMALRCSRSILRYSFSGVKINQVSQSTQCTTAACADKVCRQDFNGESTSLGMSRWR